MRAHGPAGGQVVRLVILLIMAGISFWKIRVPAGVVQLVGAIVATVLAVIAFAAR